MKADRYCK
uniref:Uncharacterized protein n=1 Tax=Anguilla anguilla TaxID=7936 RepID=A0A0E9UVB0_ANGAN